MRDTNLAFLSVCYVVILSRRFFPPSDMAINTVSEPRRRYEIPTEPLSGSDKYSGWVGNVCVFRPLSPFALKTVRDRPIVTMNP